MEEETSPTSSSSALEENLSRSSGYASLNGIGPNSTAEEKVVFSRFHRYLEGL
jgi:hypothetical protein